MRVFLSSHLRDYTQHQGEVAAQGATVDAVLRDLDRQYPGIMFRVVDEQDTIRPHINVFVNEGRIRTLKTAVTERDELHLLAALSGG